MRTALSLDARVRLAHFYSGLIYLKTGKLDEAAREFEAEMVLNPSDIQARYHLGYVALARQETERGMTLMREVIRDRPDFANAHFELGNALLKQGDTRGAVESLEWPPSFNLARHTFIINSVAPTPPQDERLKARNNSKSPSN